METSWINQKILHRRSCLGRKLRACITTYTPQNSHCLISPSKTERKETFFVLEQKIQSPHLNATRTLKKWQWKKLFEANLYLWQFCTSCPTMYTWTRVSEKFQLRMTADSDYCPATINELTFRAVLSKCLNVSIKVFEYFPDRKIKVKLLRTGAKSKA